VKWRKWLTVGLALAVSVGAVAVTASADQGGVKPAGPMKRAYWRALGIKTAPLLLRTVDANTLKPIPGAGCIIGETGDRVETDAKGVAPEIQAPIFRNPRLEEMLAALHGQLTVICYKNGYRDSVYMGVRMHEGVRTETEVWMYPVGPRDRRVEPTLYQVPVHRVWLIQLADKYRLKEEGEGPERPGLSRPDVGPTPQEEMGGGLQSPLRGGALPPAQ
jgi:hypothetical protein